MGHWLKLAGGRGAFILGDFYFYFSSEMLNKYLLWLSLSQRQINDIGVTHRKERKRTEPYTHTQRKKRNKSQQQQQQQNSTLYRISEISSFGPLISNCKGTRNITHYLDC